MDARSGTANKLNTQDVDRNLIEQILTRRSRFPFSYGEIRFELAFDRIRDRYLLLIVGWQDLVRVNGPIVHVDLKDGKFWIEYDGTEDGIATDLLEAGIPKDRIVLSFQPLSRRRYSEFAVA